MAVLAEGHMSVHSWPETGYLALDALMGRDAKPELAIDVVKQAFKPARVVVQQHLRAGAAEKQMPKGGAKQSSCAREGAGRRLGKAGPSFHRTRSLGAS